MRFLILLIASLFTRVAAAQCEIKDFINPETLQPIQFNSKLEEANLKAYYNGNKSIDLFATLISSTKDQDEFIEPYRKRLEEVFDLLEKKKINTLKNKAKAKLIFNTVHSELFRKYELINAFHEIFENGKYNCLSASFIYAMTFERFGVPYEVREMPGHVYVIAYPKSESIVVETTDPTSGIVAINKSLKKKYVSNLIANKILDKNEVLDFEREFDKHFFSSEVIGKQQLAAFQYYNYALYEMDKNDVASAYNHILKARLIDCNEQIENTLANIALNTIITSEDLYVDSNAVKISFQFANQLPSKAKKKELSNDLFGKIIKQKLYDRVEESEFNYLAK